MNRVKMASLVSEDRAELEAQMNRVAFHSRGDVKGRSTRFFRAVFFGLRQKIESGPTH
ncbi:hypothetical protein [Vibrio ostreicida]|uniref:hypothetical protein n=1 Tax=Vibrio ostreicida TaxID=526588 RepID=UPI0015C35A3F|nr:hypothetical protein [Vibrio ostreicida]